jgi:hypothetical protein
MEVGLAVASFLVSSPLMRNQLARRGARTGYRPSIALAGAQTPCKSVFLLQRARLNPRSGEVIVPQSAVAAGLNSLPNIKFKSLATLAGTGIAGPLT